MNRHISCDITLVQELYDEKLDALSSSRHSHYIVEGENKTDRTDERSMNSS